MPLVGLSPIATERWDWYESQGHPGMVGRRYVRNFQKDRSVQISRLLTPTLEWVQPHSRAGMDGTLSTLTGGKAEKR